MEDAEGKTRETNIVVRVLFFEGSRVFSALFVVSSSKRNG